MHFYIETERLILRDLRIVDLQGIFELNANEAVQKYVGNNPLKTLVQARADIDFITDQYRSNGIGRWAVIEKETNSFIGWSGLKLIKEEINGHQNFYELGYRFIPKYWRKGFATETAIASVNYGFEQLNAPMIYAITDKRNVASAKVLQKVGFKFVATFEHYHLPHNWFALKR